MLEDLRSQGNDLHEVLVAKLARHRAEDAGTARVVLRAEDDGRVLVETNGGAILPAEFARGPDDDRLDHLALLHLAAGRRNRHGGCDDVADGGVLAVVAAHHPDQQDLTRTRVVRHLQPRLLLDHRDCYFAFSTMATTRQRLSCDSARVSMIRTRSPTLHWFCSSCALNRVACWMCFLYFGCSLSVCTRTMTVLSILSLMTVPVRVLRIARSIAWSSLLTSVTSETSQTLAWHSSAARVGRGPAAAGLGGRRLRRGCRLAGALLQENLGQDLRQVVADVPDLAVVLQLAGRHLEAQVEELLAGVLELLLQIRHGKGLEVLHLHFFPPPLAGLAGAAALGAAAAAFGAAPGAAFGAAPGAGFTDGAAPGAALGPRAGAAGVGAAAAPAMPSTPSPGLSSAGPLIFTSAAALTPDLMPSVRVFIGSL